MSRVASHLAAALLAGAALSVAAASAALAGPATHGKGALSATEFAHLSAEITALKAAESGKKIDWAVADAACRRAGTATGLLRVQRRYCLTVNATSQAQIRLQSEGVKCAAKIAETTPATTTPSTAATRFEARVAAEVRQLGCLNAGYQTLGRDARAYYHEDQVAYRTARARGFRGLCFRTLSDTAEQVRHVESFAFTAEHLADDAALIVRVRHGHAPSSDVNPVWVNDDARDFAAALEVLGKEKPVEQLGSCPHS